MITILAIILAIENDTVRSFVEQIYDNYSKQIYKIAYDILCNHYDAEDVVHDVIIKIIDKVGYYQAPHDEQSLKKVIVITTRNQAINKYNENKRRASKTVSITQVCEDGESYERELIDMDTEIDVDNILLCEENVQILQKIIDKLDTKYRDVFVLMSQGYNNKEISEIMGISVENVRQRFSRGKAKIIELGGDQFYGIQRK